MTESGYKNFPTLRKKAEAVLARYLDRAGPVLERDAIELVHELSACLIELEMQNEELRKSQIEAQESKGKYAELYHFAPVGYLTFDGQGVIAEANATAAKLLGTDRGLLIGSPFSAYLASGSETFHSHIGQVLKTESKAGCEVTLKRDDGSLFPALLESIGFLADGEKVVRTILTDITERKRAEEEARKRVEEIAAILEAVPAAVWIAHDPDCRHITGNRASYELLNLPHGAEASLDAPPETRPTHFKAMKDGRELPNEELPLHRAARGEVVCDYEFSLAFNDGSVRHVLGNARPMFGGQGRARGSVAAFVDVTERKRMAVGLAKDAAALARLHQLSTKVMEAGGVEGLLQEIMDAAVEIAGSLGSSLRLLEGGSLRAVAHHGHKRPLLEFFAEVECRPFLSNEVLKRGRTMVVEDVESSALYAGTPALQVLREAGVRAVLSTPMFSRSGRLIGVLNIQWDRPYRPDENELRRIGLLARQAADLIEHARASEEVRRSRDELELRVEERTRALSEANEKLMQEVERRSKAEREFAALSQNSPDMILRYDRDLRCLYGNPAIERKSGIPNSLRIGRTLGDLGYPREMIERLEKPLKAAFETGQEQVLEGELQVGSGTFYALANFVPEFGEDGSVDSVLVVSHDLTEQRRLEEQLRQSQKLEAIGTLAGGIAHDFNNMLAIIIGNAELALDEVEEEGARRNLNQILDASKRSRDLVRQILTFSSKGPRGEGKVLEVAPILEETYRLLRASLPSTINMKLNIRAKGGVSVTGEVSQIQQVVVNLANNAAHAMGDGGGELTIGLSTVTGPKALHRDGVKPGKYVKLTVKDTGCGIAPEIQGRIFEPFFTTKGQGRGTGMGLATVYGIVKNYGGTVEVESEVGKGSRFTVLLPEVDGLSMKEQEGEEEEAAASPSPQKAHVLFVDDEAAVVEMAKKVFPHLGYRVTAFTDSREALEAFTKAPAGFDLVVTDHTMPDMTGAVLAGRLLALRKDLPIILCTGYSDAISPQKAKEIGIREFLMKPVTNKEMEQAVERVLEWAEGIEQDGW